jgi:hypothetical protein
MRTFLATILGLVVGIAATKGLEILGHKLFPIELDIAPNNIEELKLLMFKVPPFFLVIVIIAHVLGLILGFTVSRLIEKKSILPLYYISGILLLFAVINLLTIKHPLWFVVTDLTLMVLISIIVIRKKSKAQA